jgi:acetyl esterase/lipase
MLKPALEKLTPDMKKYADIDKRRVIKHVLAYGLKHRINVFKFLRIYNRILAATEKAYKLRVMDLEAVNGYIPDEDLQVIAKLFLQVINASCADESKHYLKANPAANDVTCERVMAGTVPACWFTPPQAIEGKVFYYIHGGGWFTGSMEASKDFCLEIALATRLRVLSIDYRMYPQHPHPAQVDDAEIAYDWLVDSGIVPENIIIAGESAGAHLTLLLVNRLKASGKQLPAGEIIMSPPIDLSFSNPDLLTNVPSDPVLGLSGAGIVIMNLLRNAKTEVTGPSGFSPLEFDLTGFPPMLLQVSTCEALYSDATIFRAKAEAAGVKITFHAWDGMIHAFQAGARKEIKEVKEANAKVAEFTREILAL